MKLIVSFSCSICGRLPFIFLNLTQNRFLGSVQFRTNLVDIFMVNERESNSCPRNISQRMINSPLFCAHSHIISMKNIMGSWPKMREMCYMIGEWFGMIQSFAWPLFMCLPYVCHLVSFDFICSIGRNLELILIYSSWNVELKNHWFFFPQENISSAQHLHLPHKEIESQTGETTCFRSSHRDRSGVRVCSDA